MAAVVFTLALLAVLILPVFLLAGSLIDGVESVTAHVKSGAAIIPPPPSPHRRLAADRRTPGESLASGLPRPQRVAQRVRSTN